MDTILGFFQSMSVSSDTQHTLFLLATGATVFLFAFGVSFLVLATMDLCAGGSTRSLQAPNRTENLRPAC